MRVQPRKVRIIADEIRGKNAIQAAHVLKFHPSKSARMLRKILISAMANAEENGGLSADTLKVIRITVDEGPRLKRIQARAQGRANRIVKKTSHITVIVEDSATDGKIKPHGTKAKPRPVFAAQKKASKKAAAPVAEDVVATETAAEEVVETVVEEAPAAVVEAEATTEATPVEEAGAEATEGDTAKEEGN